MGDKIVEMSKLAKLFRYDSIYSVYLLCFSSVEIENTVLEDENLHVKNMSSELKNTEFSIFTEISHAWLCIKIKHFHSELPLPNRGHTVDAFLSVVVTQPPSTAVL